MTELTSTVTSNEDEHLEAPKRSAKKNSFLSFLLWLVVSFVIGASIQYFLPTYLGLWQIPSQWPDKVLTLQARLDQVERRLAVLDQKPEGASVAQGVPAGSDLGDFEKLKDGLATVSTLIGALQSEVTQSSATTKDVRDQTQVGLAAVLAFIQMQNAALAGHPFEDHRQALRKLASGDEPMIALLLKLEKPALNGAPTIESLREEWRTLAAVAQTALRKAAAQTWQDRIVVALEGLVSIRSLKPKPGETLSFAAVDLDLVRGDVAAALAKVDALPQEAQGPLQDWRAKASLRLEMEQTLVALVTHMIERGYTEEPSAAPKEEEATPVPEVKS